ncbi:TPA: hypothetical protein N0F65_006389 [Lagenidium giganteum]|uniref:D-lactate dehydrogenase n=1 Tax=Lagenidium giganteum TaxID=4803 RepID=A0AAV2YPN1_9STRA|nr:TPA: hypothetical protein N0F65_006389 [Lagenidium giganteum]
MVVIRIAFCDVLLAIFNPVAFWNHAIYTMRALNRRASGVGGCVASGTCLTRIVSSSNARCAQNNPSMRNTRRRSPPLPRSIRVGLVFKAAKPRIGSIIHTRHQAATTTQSTDDEASDTAQASQVSTTTAKTTTTTTTTTAMKIAFYSAHSYDTVSMKDMAHAKGLDQEHEFQFFQERLNVHTAPLAEGCEGVCIFVNDTADEPTLRKLYDIGVRVLFLRCAGFDMVELPVAKELGMPVLRVPAYSPYAVAEFAASLMMTLNRNIHRAYNRTRELNFRLSGLLGFDLHGKTVGVVGTGKIGVLFAKICLGFGCNVLAYDVMQNPEAVSLGIKYVTLDEIWAQSHIISLHCPLFPNTRHIVNEESIKKMKDGVMIINTSRGGLIDTSAMVKALKSKKIGAVGLDVFEGEGDYFYSDRSGAIIADDTLARLFTFPNVLITGHQAFFTKEALDNIASTTMANIVAYTSKSEFVNEVK